MSYFDMSEAVHKNIAEIETKAPEMLSKSIAADPKAGPQQVAELLTFLPEEQRMGALTGFVMAMLCD